MTTPKTIYLLNMGDTIDWCDVPNPDDHDRQPVEYVRKDQLTDTDTYSHTIIPQSEDKPDLVGIYYNLIVENRKLKASNTVLAHHLDKVLDLEFNVSEDVHVETLMKAIEVLSVHKASL